LFLFVRFICSVAVWQLFIKDFDWLIDWSCRAVTPYRRWATVMWRINNSWLQTRRAWAGPTVRHVVRRHCQYQGLSDCMPHRPPWVGRTAPSRHSPSVNRTPARHTGRFCRLGNKLTYEQVHSLNEQPERWTGTVSQCKAIYKRREL